MNLKAVIHRELRASARQRFTYYLRALGVGALLVASVWFAMEHDTAQELGGQLFASLHRILFFGIWLLVPILTADCLSRERREGTLGLLFLTGLKGQEIVVAKGLAHGFRALALLAAAIPVLTLPFLLGGLSWPEILISAMLNVSSLFLALAAGLLGSALSRKRGRALVTAVLLSLCFLLAFITAAGASVWLSIRPGSTSTPVVLPEINLPNISLTGLVFCVNNTDVWTRYFFPLATPSGILFDVLWCALFSLMLVLLAIVAAGRRITRVWQELPRARQILWLEQTFCRPVLWLSLFQKWMRHQLERNPIGWLEQRTWSGRLVTWGWLAVVVGLYSALLTDRGFARSYEALQFLIAWSIMGSMAVSSAGSFRRERETGVMELLLVSPLRESEIISGRLRGIWMQFIPAFVLLLSVWVYLGGLFPQAGPGLGAGLLISTFITTPVIGLYFSLRSRTLVGAALSTLGTGVLAPFLIADILSYVDSLNRYGTGTPWGFRDSGKAVILQFVFAGLCWSGLHARLRDRRFPLTMAA